MAGLTGPRPGRSDGGSATVYVLVVAVTAWMLTALVSSLGAVAVARHRAQAAADLAALAAASRLGSGTAAACASAGAVAGPYGATVTSCAVDAAGAVVVEVLGPRPRLLVPVDPAHVGIARPTARARAG